jgi:hypothetical protein
MILAFQCGKWDIDRFEKQIPKRILDRWENWFRKRPQGQDHMHRLLASIASAICGSNGHDVPPDTFRWWDREPVEELSIDEQVDTALARLREINPVAACRQTAGEATSPRPHSGDALTGPA